jgi:hypothetical protein
MKRIIHGNAVKLKAGIESFGLARRSGSVLGFGHQEHRKALT